ncbi:MAG: M2 family metallopeptidase [Myxococcota bacterium]|nr:M2 family metallopeptidase [Myxococcota bacterium]
MERRTLGFVGIITLMVGCGGASTPASTEPVEAIEIETTSEERVVTPQQRAEAFQTQYIGQLIALYRYQTNAYWKAANTGEIEDFETFAKADFELKKLHSDKDAYRELLDILAHKDQLDPLTKRSLEVAELNYRGNQMPEDKLEAISKASAEIEQIFASFRGELDGEKFSDNDLQEMLAEEKKSKKRQAIWETMKQVGAAAAPNLVELVKLRNEAAKSMGYKNFWEMAILLQEHDPAHLMAIFAELETVTDAPFEKMKAKLDQEIAKKLKVKRAKMMPWHYDNPFFQAPPPSAEVNLDDFFEKRKKEEIVALGDKFFTDIGLPLGTIVEKSDFYEREGKNQHAFCIDMDKEGDVRTLLNIKPTANWMEVMLHEQGHAVYSKFIDRELPYNLRDAAHIFTTEAVAMLFGALVSNPTWLRQYAGVDATTLVKKTAAILEQRKREQLIFSRWTMVMFHFEKSLYENPDQDLNKLWWDYVERFQGLTRPADRDQPDWAAKIHFAIAPVYYHNYMLGELMAAQMRSTLVRISGHQGAATTLDFTAHSQFESYFKEKIFAPAQSKPWPEFVKDATGEPLTAKHFAAELQ